MFYCALLKAWNPEREQVQKRAEENNQAVEGEEEENEHEEREHRVEMEIEPEIPGQREAGGSDTGEMEEVEIEQAFQEAIGQIEGGLLDTEQDMELKARECTEQTEAKKVVEKERGQDEVVEKERGQDEGVMNK